MRVLAVTSWGTACGIAAYADSLIDALGQVAPDITMRPVPEALDPEWLLDDLERTAPGDLPHGVWLNWHLGLHSRWHEGKIAQLQDQGIKVAVSWHDSRGETAPTPLQLAVHDAADAFVVHEPCEGLPKAIYLRQGVPARPHSRLYSEPAPWCRPLLGTVGWNFPWKNYDRLAEVTAACGWELLLVCNNATEEDVQRWQGLNPHTYVKRGFLPTAEIVGLLTGCDATAFCYECGNTGTSGAIRLGIAARKPVIGFRGCRQFRDLLLADLGYWDTNRSIISWADDFGDLSRILAQVPIQRCDPGIVALAHRDSWTNQGRAYADIFRRVAGAGR